MNIKQFFGSSGIPPGMSVPMPALASAGTNQYVTSANELYVNTTNPSLIPQSSCDPLLPAALGATNDVMFPTTQVSLAGFQMAANVPASGFFAGLISSSGQLSTKGFYVGNTYYLFSPCDTSNTIGWISSTDLQNYTPFVQVTPLAGMLIVDVFYNTLNSTWYFLEANGSIFSTTNLATLANPVYYSLPALSTANGYIRLTQINGNWYAVGGSTTGSGYRISSSTNLAAWTVVLENTSGGYPAFNIVQGGGAGANTEILVVCTNNVLLKSTNNGASFSALTSAIAISGQTVSGLANIFYSPRTGLYYIGVTTSSYTYVAVSSTTTLATATWTTYNTGYTAAGASNANINFVDTGTWVGPVYAIAQSGVYFFSGASYNTISPTIINFNQMALMGGAGDTYYYQGAKAMWLNNTLVVAYSSGADPSYGYQRTNAMLAVATGPTCSTGIAINLWFPLSQIGNATAQWMSWSGVANWNGAYYAGAGALTYSGASIYNYTLFLFKLNLALTTFSCPAVPVSQYIGISANTTSQYILSNPMPVASGAGLYWVAMQNSSANNLQQVSGLPVFSYNGTSITIGIIGSAYGMLSGVATSSTTVQGYTLPGQPSGNVCTPKWSGLLNAYVLANPACVVSGTTGNPQPQVAIGTIPSIATNSLTNIATYATGTANQTASVSGLDVLSSGGIVYVIQTIANNNIANSLYAYFGGTVIPLISSGTTGMPGVPSGYAMWEVVSASVSYLVYAYISNSTASTVLNVWKMSTTDGPTLVVNAFPVTNISLTATVTNNLRRVFGYNGSFLLGDTAAVSNTARNSLMLTPNSLASFSIAPDYLQVSGYATPAGLPNVYTTTNSLTTVNPNAPIPSVFVPAGPTSNYLRVR